MRRVLAAEEHPVAAPAETRDSFYLVGPRDAVLGIANQSQTQIPRAKLLLALKDSFGRRDDALGVVASGCGASGSGPIGLSELAEFFAVRDEIRIGAATELVEIQALPFALQNHALGPDSIQDEVQAIGERQNKTN